MNRKAKLESALISLDVFIRHMHEYGIYVSLNVRHARTQLVLVLASIRPSNAEPQAC